MKKNHHHYYYSNNNFLSQIISNEREKNDYRNFQIKIDNPPTPQKMNDKQILVNHYEVY